MAKWQVRPPVALHRACFRLPLRLVAPTAGGLLLLQYIMPMAATAQADPQALDTPNAAAVITNRNAVSSQTIMHDTLKGKAIIIVGGKGRLDPNVIHDLNGISSLNPQPLPPDPPPNALGNRTLSPPPAVMQAPAKSRTSGGGTLQ